MGADAPPAIRGSRLAEHPNFDGLAVGDSIPQLTVGPITRTTLALFCGASGDHNPIHVDTDFARSAGMDDVIAHGMLSMAYLGRLVTDWAPIERMRGFSCRFLSPTHVGDIIVCTGIVEEKSGDPDDYWVRLTLEAVNQQGVPTVKGSVLIDLRPL